MKYIGAAVLLAIPVAMVVWVVKSKRELDKEMAERRVLLTRFNTGHKADMTYDPGRDIR